MCILSDFRLLELDVIKLEEKAGHCFYSSGLLSSIWKDKYGICLGVNFKRISSPKYVQYMPLKIKNNSHSLQLVPECFHCKNTSKQPSHGLTVLYLACPCLHNQF